MVATVSAVKASVSKMQGDWLCRDMDGWRVKIPTANGHGFFSFEQYGGVNKAFNAARAFQIKMYKQYQEDLKHKQKHGELPERERLHMNNRTGIPGVCRTIRPNQMADPHITWTGFATINGKTFRQSFTTTNFSEAECKKRAIEFRDRMMARKR